MESPNLTTAFRAARRSAYRDALGRRLPLAPAAAALKLARENLAAMESASAAYDAARARVADLKADALGQPAAAESIHVAAAEAAEKTALRRLTAARELAGAHASPVWGGGRDYGAGTWQGGNPDATPSALPFNVPPAMRTAERAARGWHGARAMHNRPDSDSPAMGSPRRDAGGRFYWHNDSDVLRNVRDAGDVVRLGHNGWFDNPYGESWRDGDGLVVGVVGQLRARDGRAVFVAGWRFTGHDDNGTFAMRELFTADGREESDAEAAAEDAARAADSLAERAAEAEREYQAAWGAGQAWADKGEELAAARASVRALLAERREARKAGKAELPAICRAIRDSVSGFLADMAEARREREELAEGNAEPLWHDGGRDARAAFCEGAGIPVTAAPF